MRYLRKVSKVIALSCFWKQSGNRCCEKCDFCELWICEFVNFAISRHLDQNVIFVNRQFCQSSILSILSIVNFIYFAYWYLFPYFLFLLFLKKKENNIIYYKRKKKSVIFPKILLFLFSFKFKFRKNMLNWRLTKLTKLTNSWCLRI